MHSDESYVLKALKAGARAYLLKDSAEHDLIAAVRAVSEGKAFFSPAISKMLVEDYMRQMQERAVEDSYELLTTREREVLAPLGRRQEITRDVAQLLNLSLAYQVETHPQRIIFRSSIYTAAPSSFSTPSERASSARRAAQLATVAPHASAACHIARMLCRKQPVVSAQIDRSVLPLPPYSVSCSSSSIAAPAAFVRV